ncbi:MAG: methyltransferase [Citricoccus sp.]|nr:methyltransferase [Citricoccus sp. WCRC_4]
MIITAGTVLPIQTRAGDSLAIHRALADAHPGDVLVINANSDTNRACFGDFLGELCIARGVSPAGPFKYGPGVIGTPVACGNVVCNPGDAILGDSDGIVVIPRHLIHTTLENTRAQENTEAAMRGRIPALTH